MATELLQCPFCGSLAELYGYDTAIDAWAIQCTNPGCEATVRSKDSESQAVAAWNRRVAGADVQAAISDLANLWKNIHGPTATYTRVRAWLRAQSD